MQERADNTPPMNSDEMYGLAKKINRELEQLPLHTHGAMIQLINVAFEHRNLSMKRAEAERQQDIQRRQLEIQEAQMRAHQQALQAHDAKEMQQHIDQQLVPQ